MIEDKKPFKKNQLKLIEYLHQSGNVDEINKILQSKNKGKVNDTDKENRKK